MKIFIRTKEREHVEKIPNFNKVYSDLENSSPFLRINDLILKKDDIIEIKRICEKTEDEFVAVKIEELDLIYNVLDSIQSKFHIKFWEEDRQYLYRISRICRDFTAKVRFRDYKWINTMTMELEDKLCEKSVFTRKQWEELSNDIEKMYFRRET